MSKSAQQCNARCKIRTASSDGSLFLDLGVCFNACMQCYFAIRFWWKTDKRYWVRPPLSHRDTVPVPPA